MHSIKRGRGHRGEQKGTDVVTQNASSCSREHRSHLCGGGGAPQGTACPGGERSTGSNAAQSQGAGGREHSGLVWAARTEGWTPGTVVAWGGPYPKDKGRPPRVLGQSRAIRFALWRVCSARLHTRRGGVSWDTGCGVQTEGVGVSGTCELAWAGAGDAREWREEEGFPVPAPRFPAGAPRTESEALEGDQVWGSSWRAWV